MRIITKSLIKLVVAVFAVGMFFSGTSNNIYGSVSCGSGNSVLGNPSEKMYYSDGRLQREIWYYSNNQILRDNYYDYSTNEYIRNCYTEGGVRTEKIVFDISYDNQLKRRYYFSNNKVASVLYYKLASDGKYYKYSEVIYNSSSTITNRNYFEAWTAPFRYNSMYITSSYGWRYDPFTGKNTFHDGVDITLPGSPSNIPVVTVNAGTVSETGYNSAKGNYVVVRHPRGHITTYSHLASISVSVGKNLGFGDTVGIMGTTGMSTGNHLHLKLNDGSSNPCNLHYNICNANF